MCLLCLLFLGLKVLSLPKSFFLFDYAKHCCCCFLALSHVQLWDPMNDSRRASLSFTISQVGSDSCPLIWWYHTTISSSVAPFSSCPQSFPASGSFPRSQLFASGGQSIGASASAAVLPVNIQGWFPLGLTDLIQSMKSSEMLVTQLCPTLWSKAYLFLRSYSDLSFCRKLFQTIWGFTILFAPWSSLFHNLYCKSHHFILCFQTGIILIYMWISEGLLLFQWLPVMSEIPPGATIPLV